MRSRIKAIPKIVLTSLLVLSCLLTRSSLAEIEGTEFTEWIGSTTDTGFNTKLTSPFYEYTMFFFRAKITLPLQSTVWCIPEGYSAKWYFQIDAEIEVDEKVNHIELYIWVPKPDGKEWKYTMNIRPGSSLRAQLSSSYLGDGWYLYSFDAPEGEYFYKYEVISVDFLITNPDNLERGSHNLTKISYAARGDFAGEERFVRGDIVVIKFRVNIGFDSHHHLWEIWTTNENGEYQDSFSVFESVYLSPKYYISYGSKEIYIVPDRDWQDGDLLTDLPRYGIHKIYTSLLIWNSDDLPLIPGAYDVVYDRNNNGIYDIKRDPVYGFRVPGFIVTPSFMVPEFPLGTLSVLGASILALVMNLKIKHKKRQI